jgi:ATP-dependent helicase/nuclease subunit B
MQEKETAALLTALDRGAIIITVNDRLARALRLTVAEQRQRSGMQVWAQPAILSWTAWLQKCLDDVMEQALSGGSEPPPVFLNTHQAEAVWESIIERSGAGRGLLQIGAAARAAAEAWDLICGWRVPLSELTTGAGDALPDTDIDDVRVFADWVRTYQRRSEREGWLDQPRLADYLNENMRSGQLGIPGEIVLAGFDELRPQFQLMLRTLEQAGCRTTHLAAPELEPASIELHSCADTEAECRTASIWARHILQNDPAAHIGIVVHDLAACRSLVTRALDESLQPQTRLPCDAATAPPYNVSLGFALARTPLIHDALQCLELGSGPVEWTVVSALLRSPFFAGAEVEQDARARLDARLRRRGFVRLGLNDLCYWAETAGDCPQLLTRLQRVKACLQSQPRRQSAGVLAAAISQFLNAIGWSHGRTLDSREYQTVQAWWDLLAAFASLEAYTTEQSWRDALTRLRTMAGQKLFQPQSVPARVQVLGMLETSGLSFDYLWIMGLHDGQWPASPRPHPFLPVQLQRHYNMPHAGAERELRFARQMTQRLLASAAHIVISWPAREGDSELRPSPLFHDVALADQRIEPELELMHHVQANTMGIEKFDDIRPPPLAELEQPRGGTAVLKNQAACPFRAFATHRLHATAPDEPEPGLNALARGSLMHAVMQAIWETLSEQSALRQEQIALQSVVMTCVERAVSGWEQDNHYPLPPRFRTVECARLTALALEWLRLDAERTDFTVEAREAEQSIDIGGLHLHGRLDRLDRLPDGRCLIIDYKTGNVDPKVWLDERPDDPQLPLYALAHREQLAGVAFAQLRVGDMKYAGVASHTGLAPGLVTVAEWKTRPADCDDLPALLDYWQAQLTDLAAAFRAGVADVDPKDPRRTCTYCDLGPLCRIDELSQGRHDLERVDGDE